MQLAGTNVKQLVPLLAIASMDASLHFYVDGLGFAMTRKWVVDGKVRWCWLELGDAAVMLQQFSREGHDSFSPRGPVGEGVGFYFTCADALALYREFQSRGLHPSEPQVGNSMWVTEVKDPDGYRLLFESPTDVAEDTKLSEVES